LRAASARSTGRAGSRLGAGVRALPFGDGSLEGVAAFRSRIHLEHQSRLRALAEIGASERCGSSASMAVGGDVHGAPSVGGHADARAIDGRQGSGSSTTGALARQSTSRSKA